MGIDSVGVVAMKKFLLVLLFCLLPVNVFAENLNRWTVPDVVLQGTYLTLHGMDWSQTLHIARNPDDYREKNKILGEHPSKEQVNRYFALTAIGHTTIAHFAPSICKSLGVAEPKFCRTVWQATWIFIQWNTVAKNHEAGLKISFRW